jgi:hypothetical protein
MAFNSLVLRTMERSVSTRCHPDGRGSTCVVLAVPFMPWLSALAAIISLLLAKTERFRFGTSRSVERYSA